MKILYITLIAFYSILISAGCEQVNDEHAGHDHSSDQDAYEAQIKSEESQIDEHADCDHDELVAEDEHEGHDHDEPVAEDEHAGHDHGEEEGLILSAQARKLAGIQYSNVTEIKIGKQIEIPGEVDFNEENLAHITPRYPGVAREVYAKIGQFVERGTELASIESNESLSSYKVLAPISGHIISKHITPGEFKSEEEDMFVIVDLSSVWVNCVVYPNNMQSIKTGQKIVIQDVGSELSATGKISYVAPVYDKNTRSAIARTVLPNANGDWRPGMFIKGIIETSTPTKVPAILKSAVQVMDNETVVFVREGQDSFISKVVTIGEGNDQYVELLSGLNPGEEYVSEGAFELKAKVVTSSLGAHAGHGH